MGSGLSGFLIRFLFSALLVGATYNPTMYNYYQWAVANLPTFGPEQTVLGIVLLIGWIIFLRATFRSLGALGIALASALFTALVWLLISWGWISPDAPSVIEYIVLIVVALVLALGMSWSSVRRAVSGQTDVDDVDA
ncbi:MAG: hypothetical protein ACI9W2_003876 [Gammaproteobacteria bacterium]|jgi:hypothetical protein